VVEVQSSTTFLARNWYEGSRMLVPVIIGCMLDELHKTATAVRRKTVIRADHEISATLSGGCFHRFFWQSPSRKSGACFKWLQSKPALSRSVPISRAAYRKQVWVTRPRPGVDRVTSAWLIRKFIDPKARFAFSSEDQKPPGAVPFDMYGDDGLGIAGRTAPGGFWSSLENANRAFGSMNLRISHADVTRSTPGRGLVTHTCFL